MKGICTSCKKKKEIVLEERDTEIDINDDGKPIAARTVAYRSKCKSCA